VKRIITILKINLALALLLAASSCAVAQDPHFSQFFETPLLRNPALAGLFDGDVRVQGVYRSQWGSVSVPYITVSLNGEYKQPIGKGNDFLTMGMAILYDKAGDINFTTINVMPVLNYHKSFSDDKTKYLSLGLMAGWVNRNIDRSKVTTNNQFDGFGYNPSLPDGETFPGSGYSYWDGSVGLSFNSSINGNRDYNYYIGVAYHHFNRPVNSFYKDPTIELNPKWVVSGGIKLPVSEVAYMTIEGDFSQQGSFSEDIAGFSMSYKFGSSYDRPDYQLHLGAYLRWNDAFIPVVKLDYHPYSIAISYDANISTLRTASQGLGGFELSVSYIGFLDRDNSTKNSVVCPRF